MRPTVRTAAAVVVSLLALASCGSGGGRAPTSPLTATVTNSRAAQARGLVNVVLGNPSDRVVQVRTLALDDVRFAPEPPTERLVTIAPHTERLMVPIPLGAGRCVNPLATPHVVVDAEEVPVDDAGRAVLDAIVEDACVREAIDATVDLTFPEVARDGSTVDVVLRLNRRRSQRVVTVDSVGSNVIYTVTADLPATLAADDEAIDVTVRFDADRCEPHALAESKKTFQFPFWIALDDGEPQFVELAMDDDVRDALQAALDACAAARG